MRLLRLALLCCLALTPATDAAAAQDDERPDQLLDELQSLDKRRDDRAGTLQARIWSIWYAHEDPDVCELMREGRRALGRDRHQQAVAIFSRLVERGPDYAEAWNRRSAAYYLLGRYEASLDDIERVLELEPRHFGALAGKGLCLRELGRPRPALEALRRALDVNPHLDNVYLEILRIRSALATPPSDQPGAGKAAVTEAQPRM